MSAHKALCNDKFIRRSEKRKIMISKFQFLKQVYSELPAKWEFAKERYKASKEFFLQLTNLGLDLKSTVLCTIKSNLHFMSVHFDHMGSLFPKIFMELNVLEKLINRNNLVLFDQFKITEKKIKKLCDSFLDAECQFLRHCGDFTSLFIDVLNCADSKLAPLDKVK
ncbi:unnamed protein product [Larinioides sclopetarius]|uniref:General transcription factor II-I repeat domain-containing protein 2 n=1 Tax=Larinioides sclopetarius TaxID=280406 RepID=A0AAV2BLQ5_9ARAC